MNVNVSNSGGPIVCRLRLDNGSVVGVGSFELHRGKGEWARTIEVDTGRLRGAKLYATDGSMVASANFA
jgi:hypothetical protein